MDTDKARRAAFLVQYAGLLLLALLWVQMDYVRARVGDNLDMFYLLDALALCYVGLRAYLVLSKRLSPWWSHVWLAADLVIITCAVYLTGGIRSEAALVYFWPLATSSIQRRPRRTTAVGLATAVLYTAATWPPDPNSYYLTTLATRIFILLVATYVAVHYARGEVVRVEQMSRLREKVALADYRTRLSREMHDGIQHYLVNIATRLELAKSLIDEEPQKAARMAVDQRFAVRQAADELRYLVRLLRSPAVEREGFIDALKHHLHLFAGRSSISASLAIEGNPNPVPPEVAHAAFRILQEALTNVEKHAQADDVTVTLKFSPDVFECAIADQGVGFDQSNAPDNPAIDGGLGLLSMRERAESVGGSLHVNTAPGRGTEITFSVPMHDRDITSAEDTDNEED